jgi:outer membrane receptor protein involved in Fe transport
MSPFRFFSVLTILLSVGAGELLAQVSIAGTIQDPSGAAVTNAEVVLKASEGVPPQTTRTDYSGAFRFDRLLPGNYGVEVTHGGFKVFTTRLRIGSRPPAPLRIKLALADLQQQITVGSQATQVNTDTTENLDTVQLQRRMLDALPVFDQDYVSAAARFLHSSSLGTDGATLVVDGMETSEKGVSASAILEVKINQNPYSAEFSRPGRGRIEIITKPGSSEYHGAFNLLFRDHRMNARDAFALTRPAEQRRIFEGNLSGPVASGRKSSFLISLNREEEDLEAIVYALGTGGVVRQNIPNPRRLTFGSVRLNRQFGQKHNVSFRYEFTDESVRNQGVGGFNLPEVGANTRNREHHVYYSHRATITSKLVNEFYLRIGTHDSPTVSVHAGPRIVVLDAFSAGGGQADRLSTENHAQFNDILSWSHGKHFIKTGMNAPDLSRRGSNDRTNFGGTFTFSSLADYVQGRPFSYVRQQGEGHLAFIEKTMGWFVQDDVRVKPNLSLAFGLRYDYQNYFPDHNNFSPRASFAFSPGQSRKTVLRGGGGFFYDRTGSGPIADLLRLNGQRLRRIVMSNPGYPDPIPAGESVSAEPTSIVRLAPHARIPYTTQFSIGVERQLQKATTITATYIGTRLIGAFRSRDVNAPLPPLYTGRPDPSIAVLRQIESSGRMQSDSLEIALRGEVTRFFSGMAQYAYGRAYNNTGGINWFPANNWNLTGEWARADFDQRHRFNLLGTVRPSRFFNLGIGLSLNSGAPYSITTGRDDNHDSQANDRPAGVSRNSLQGPGYASLDLRWSRDFFLAPSKKDKGPTATVAMDAFNVLNQVNYAGFVGNLSSPFFGQAVSARPARRLQLSIRLRF